jgi:hypothetical protein
MVGRVRVELTTSRLSGVRSNHLSYRPMRRHHYRGAQLERHGNARARGHGFAGSGGTGERDSSASFHNLSAVDPSDEGT